MHYISAFIAWLMNFASTAVTRLATQLALASEQVIPCFYKLPIYTHPSNQSEVFQNFVPLCVTPIENELLPSIALKTAYRLNRLRGIDRDLHIVIFNLPKSFSLFGTESQHGTRRRGYLIFTCRL